MAKFKARSAFTATGRKRGKKARRSGGKPKSNAWRGYVGGGRSSAPLPD
jgi:hypothetical protein